MQIQHYIVLVVLVSALANGDCIDGNLPYEVTFNYDSKEPVFNCIPILCSNKIDIRAARCLIDWENIHCNRHHMDPQM
uniref:Uncharacterized protein n=1 Tax=Parascaris univalens TaxID=6257 RepID=A0A915AN42_PARUN